MPAETVSLPLTGFGDSTVDVAVDQTPEGAVEYVKIAVSTDGLSTLVPADADGIQVKLRLDDPHDQQLIATSLGPGGLSNLDCADIPVGKVGKLLGVDVGSSVPCRWDIQVVSGARTTRTTLYTQAGESKPWRAPLDMARWFSLVGGSGIHYGIAVTNLSPTQTADARSTMYWDQQ